MISFNQYILNNKQNSDFDRMKAGKIEIYAYVEEDIQHSRKGE